MPWRYYAYNTSSTNSIARSRSGPDDVDTLGTRVGRDVVRLTKVVEVSSVLEHAHVVGIHSRQTSKLGQVEHLHAVTSCLGNDVRVIVYHLHVAPCRRGRAET